MSRLMSVGSVVRRGVTCAAALLVAGIAWADVTIRVTSEVGSVVLDGGTAGKDVSKTVAPGTSVTLTYLDGGVENRGFYEWLGLPPNVYSFGTNVSVTVNADMTVSARESFVWYVAPDGDDGPGDGTRANPFATVQRAVEVADDFDEIRVKGGLYVGNVTIPNTMAASNLVFRGSYNADWVQDYRNARTILKSSSTSKPVILIENVQTNRFDGFDITGGSHGVNARGQDFNGTPRKVFGPYTHFIFTHCVVTNNASNGFYHNVNETGDGDYGFAIASSLIAFNGGCGVSVKNDQDTSSHCYFYNCTIVSNKSHGVYGYGWYGNYLYNSIVAYNGTSGSGCDLNPAQDANQMHLKYLCAYGGASGTQGGSSGSYVQGDNYLQLDPKFTGGFELSEKSKCNKYGTDLRTNSILPVETDLYGEAWTDGEYDLGCFKSEYAAQDDAFADVYVAADGNDDNRGDSESAPMATIAAAQMKLKSGGTLHLGAGTFAGAGVSLFGAGARVVGKGRKQTLVKVTSGSGVALNHHSQIVEDLAIESSGYGVQLNQADGLNLTNVTVRNCEIRKATTGIYMTQDNVNDVQYTNFISHCVISNCTSYGIRGVGNHSGSKRRGRIVIDNTLIAFNKDGFYSDFQPPSNAPYNFVQLVNCTVVSNKTSGVVTLTNLPIYLDNTILFDNGTKNVGSLTGSNIYFDHSLCNAMISNVGTVSQVESFISHDPNFGPGFTLSEKSLCNKSGKDVSDELACLATDLNGADWNGEYDMGCYKSPYAKHETKTYDEIWVAADGSNDNEGNSPSCPLASFAAVEVKLNPGGTVHVGEGTFTDNNFTLKGDGAKIIGAGNGKSIVSISSGFGVIVGGHSALVEGLTFEGATGVRIGKEGNPCSSNVVVRNCIFRKCSNGWYAKQDNVTTLQYTNFISHCVFSNCTGKAIQWVGMHSGSSRFGRLLVDNCLLVNNAVPYYSDLQPPKGTYSGSNIHKFVNCTIVGNKTGTSTGNGLYNSFYNCIAVDNGTGGLSCNSTLTLRNVLANGTFKGVPSPLHESCRTNVSGVAELKFDTRPGREYQLTVESPARKFGSREWLEGLDGTDLLGRRPRTRRPDVGCYFCDFTDGLRILVR